MADVAGTGVRTRSLAWHSKDVIAIEVIDERSEPKPITVDLRMLRQPVEVSGPHTAIMQAASDDPTDARVVWTCGKNNDVPLGERTAWERRNGSFSALPGFDWKNIDGQAAPRRTVTEGDLAPNSLRAVRRKKMRFLRIFHLETVWNLPAKRAKQRFPIPADRHGNGHREKPETEKTNPALDAGGGVEHRVAHEDSHHSASS